jgi:predicted anti-sigma-YlaC factor YlaD
MTLNCKHVWAQVSDYIDGTVTPEMKADIERHLAHCRYCSAVLDSTRNILVLVADERTFEVPIGYGERLHGSLQAWLNSADSGAERV